MENPYESWGTTQNKDSDTKQDKDRRSEQEAEKDPADKEFDKYSSLFDAAIANKSNEEIMEIFCSLLKDVVKKRITDPEEHKKFFPAGTISIEFLPGNKVRNDFIDRILGEKISDEKVRERMRDKVQETVKLNIEDLAKFLNKKEEPEEPKEEEQKEQVKKTIEDKISSLGDFLDKEKLNDTTSPDHIKELIRKLAEEKEEMVSFLKGKEDEIRKFGLNTEEFAKKLDEKENDAINNFLTKNLEVLIAISQKEYDEFFLKNSENKDELEKKIKEYEEDLKETEEALSAAGTEESIKNRACKQIEEFIDKLKRQKEKLESATEIQETPQTFGQWVERFRKLKEKREELEGLEAETLEKLEELEAEKSAGNITEEEYEEKFNELKAELQARGGKLLVASGMEGIVAGKGFAADKIFEITGEKRTIKPEEADTLLKLALNVKIEIDKKTKGLEMLGFAKEQEQKKAVERIVDESKQHYDIFGSRKKNEKARKEKTKKDEGNQETQEVNPEEDKISESESEKYYLKVKEKLENKEELGKVFLSLESVRAYKGKFNNNAYYWNFRYSAMPENEKDIFVEKIIGEKPEAEDLNKFKKIFEKINPQIRIDEEEFMELLAKVEATDKDRGGDNKGADKNITGGRGRIKKILNYIKDKIWTGKSKEDTEEETNPEIIAIEADKESLKKLNSLTAMTPQNGEKDAIKEILSLAEIMDEEQTKEADISQVTRTFKETNTMVEFSFDIKLAGEEKKPMSFTINLEGIDFNSSKTQEISIKPGINFSKSGF